MGQPIHQSLMALFHLLVFSLIALELRIERGKRKANGQEKGVVDHPPTPGPPATGLLNPHKTHPDSM